MYSIKFRFFCDSLFTPLRIKQAQTTKIEYFEMDSVSLNKAHCSTSEIAIDTLKIITDLQFKTHKNLREWNFGAYEGEGKYLNPSLSTKTFSFN